MNIYIQNKTAKEASILKEIERPLDPKIDKLFCWNVMLIKNYGNIYKDVNTLIIRNSLTGYLIIVPYVKDPNTDLFSLIEEYIHLGITLLDLDENIIQNYFNQAGSFEYGLISNYRITNALKFQVAQLSSEFKDDLNQKDLCAKLTRDFNNKLYPSGKRNEMYKLMRQELIDLYETGRKGKGQKVYELLLTLDLDVYKVKRRFLVPSEMNFYDLRNILFKILTWAGYHLDEFQFYKNEEKAPWSGSDLILGNIENGFDPETQFTFEYLLEDLIEEYPVLYWIYDFGDYWPHKIELLEVYDDYKGEAPYLLEAEYSCPPEDVGGVDGFKEFFEIINNPNDDEYEDMMNWKGNWRKNLTKSKRTPHKIYYKPSKIF